MKKHHISSSFDVDEKMISPPLIIALFCHQQLINHHASEPRNHRRWIGSSLVTGTPVMFNPNEIRIMILNFRVRSVDDGAWRR